MLKFEIWPIAPALGANLLPHSKTEGRSDVANKPKVINQFSLLSRMSHDFSQGHNNC